MGDVITQLQLKRALRIPAAFTDDDVLLETDIIPEAEDALYRALGSWVGGLASAPRAETHRVVSRRQDLLVLKIRPIQSVQSVTDSVAGVLDPSTYTVDTQTGILRRSDDRAFTCGARVTVAYTAGLIVGDPPGSLRRACL